MVEVMVKHGPPVYSRLGEGILGATMRIKYFEMDKNGAHKS